jgi:2-polyprenyl-3-methyl-5-hydroxy-6-metoxy-1,4-benzoquinol methylase
MNRPSEARIGGGQYDANYGNFDLAPYAEVRQEAFGEDIGQNSWLTLDELDRIQGWLNLSPDKNLLDIACGAGGPALRIAESTGCSVVGIDVHCQAISKARALATQRSMSKTAEFRVADAALPLLFADASFDAIICIDAITHLPDRPRVVAEWARLLKPGGRLLFTGSTVVTGPLTNAEIAARSATSVYLFVPPGYDEGVIAQCGLHLLLSDDQTQGMAEIAERRRAARASRSTVLREIEGGEAFDKHQEFLSVAARLACENRLSRFAHLAEKADLAGEAPR